MSVQRIHVAVFAYNRPDHLERCLRDLSAMNEAKDSYVRIYVDGPRSGDGLSPQAEVVRVARQHYGFGDTDIVVREHNLGLAGSVIHGVTEMTEAFGEAIFVEDDLRLSPYFLRYMSEALDTYRTSDSVYSIHGYTYPVTDSLPDTFLLRGADCWGWATWARAWGAFDPDAQSLADRLTSQGLARSFDLDGAYPFMKMLHDNATGKNDSWAIRWHASVFLRAGLTLYPGRSLVWNAGMDGSGVHSGDLEIHANSMTDAPVAVEAIPLVESTTARSAFATYLRASERRRRWMRIRRILHLG